MNTAKSARFAVYVGFERPVKNTHAPLVERLVARLRSSGHLVILPAGKGVEHLRTMKPEDGYWWRGGVKLGVFVCFNNASVDTALQLAFLVVKGADCVLYRPWDSRIFTHAFTGVSPALGFRLADYTGHEGLCISVEAELAARM